MLIMTEGGFDFSAADCATWMEEAGFNNITAQTLTDGQPMVVGEATSELGRLRTGSRKFLELVLTRRKGNREAIRRRLPRRRPALTS